MSQNLEGRSLPVRAAVLALALITVAGLSGCSGGESDEVEAAGKAASVPVVKVAQDGSIDGALATITRPVADYEVTVDVLRLKRIDKVLRLEFAVTPRSQGADSPLNSNFFGASGSYATVGGVVLLDTENLREYRPMVTSDKTPLCVCSRELGNFALDVPAVLFADYPAPPEGVTEMTVTLPGLGPLAGVPIS